MSATVASPTPLLGTQEHLPTKRKFETIGNLVVLFAYSSVVLFTVRYHEKWSDEAQAWLLARDLPLKTLWFSELRYEGAPGLWHTILWFAQRVFHAPYDAMSYIGVAFAIGSVAVLTFRAPFPWFVRWPLAFTYFFIYQYAVIARPYTLLPLLCFTVAVFFKEVAHPVRLTVTLLLLANLSLHGTFLSAAFGSLYLAEALRRWSTFSSALRKRYAACIGIMIITFIFLFIILKPTPDNEEFVVKRQIQQLPEAIKQQMHLPTPTVKLSAVISGAFLDSPWPSAAFLVAAAAWSARRRQLLVFILPVGLMIALYSIVHGYAHHHGTVFVAAVTALWVAWPNEQDQRTATRRDIWVTRGFTTLLILVILVNIGDATVTIKREYQFPYSGAGDAAAYVKSVGADRGPMFGLLYGVTAVEAYFDHNIFQNLPTTYFHHGLPLTGTWLDTDALQQIRPEYVVVYSAEPNLLLNEGARLLIDRGYALVHFSDGYYLYKRGVYQREIYFIFRRTQP